MSRQAPRHDGGSVAAEYLVGVGDSATDEPMGTTEQNLASAVVGETYEFTAMYPGFASTACEEGFEEVADWFSTLVAQSPPTPVAIRRR